MEMGVSKVPGSAEPKGEPGAREEETLGSEHPAGVDPLYEQALTAVQQGRWMDAQEALAELQVQYPGSAAVHAVQKELELHLSAERTWGAEAQRRVTRRGRSKTVRVLLVANIVLYVAVALVWLLLQLSRLLR